ncbi:MAG: hypothetical protein ACTSRU_07745 [Candidatus Hodarchaeales archaeon]
MDQIVIRNRKKGYEITFSTDQGFNPDYLPQLLPECASLDQDLKYFTKNILPDGTLVIKLVVADGTDSFGRYVMKAHNLLIKRDEYGDYLKNGLPFYISPLLDDHITNTSDYPLDLSIHFRQPNISSIKPISLFYDLLHDGNVTIYSSYYDPPSVMMLFSVLDLAIPPEVKDQISIISYIPATMIDQEIDAKIVFRHYKGKSISNRGKAPKNRESMNFLSKYFQDIGNPSHRKHYQQLLVTGDPSCKNLSMRFRKKYQLSKSGTAHATSKKIMEILKTRYQTRKSHLNHNEENDNNND